MIPLFLGLTAGNVLLLGLVFVLGLGAVDEAAPTRLYGLHVALGVAAGLMTALTHLSVFTYFMATSKWLAAATDQAGADLARWAGPATSHKHRAYPLVLGAVGLTMIAMFAGAGADPTVRPLWPGEVHLVLAAAAVAANLLCAVGEHRLIRAQQALMDDALAALNALADHSPAIHPSAGHVKGLS